jgi:predicted DNA-binding transcriptional regulator YafY
VTRTLRPYGLVLKAGRWYLVAAGTPGRVATYRVSQILDLRPREDHFGRPADFDLAGYWQAYLAEWESRRHRGEAVIRLSPDGRERARHLLEPAARRPSTRQQDRRTPAAGSARSSRSRLPRMPPANCCTWAPTSRPSSPQNCAT